MTKVSGAALTTGTLDTWQSCDTIRSWTRTANGLMFTGQISIRSAVSGVILDTAIVELDNVTV